MKENINKLFHQEIREKKTVASGAHGKKGKKGRVGKMVTPADITGREYREARDLPSFNVYDFIHKLHEAPILKSVLLERMDEEYQTYRQATEKALDALAEILQLGLDPVYQEIADLRQQMETLSRQWEVLWVQQEKGTVNLSSLLAGRQDQAPAVPRPGGPLARQHRTLSGKKRIRWGSSPEAIRATVFAQLHQLVVEGEEITTETIKQQVPSMLRWIYGDRAVFDGIEGLRREFLQAEAEATRQAAGTEDSGVPGDLAPTAEEELA